jgi:ATP-dependent DNA helicase
MNIDYTPADERQRVQRLRTLIERSKIYTSILADKLLKQQSEARERGEEVDRQKRLAENKEKREAVVAAGATRKSSRAATAENTAHVEQESPKKSRASKSTASASKAAPAKGKKGGKMSIAHYFNKKELDTGLSTTGAFKQAREEVEDGDVDVGVTTVTKPSASARQPELVTGCVLRDYQVLSFNLRVLIAACWA